MGSEILETDLSEVAVHNFKIYRGDDWSLELTFTDENSQPIDFTDCDVKMQIKKDAKDTTAVKELSLGSGITLSGDDNNVLTLASDGDIQPRSGDYVYDLQVTDPGGKNKTYLMGTFKVKQDVTR